MPKYIDLDKLPLVAIDVDTRNKVAYVDIREVQQALRQAEAETGEVAPVVHAAWYPIGMDKRGRGGIWVCSACDSCEPYKKDFCPNCGAKMDAKRNMETEVGHEKTV